MSGTRTISSRTIQKQAAERKRLFRMALASAGLSLRQWCEREGYTHGHLSPVLSGHRPAGRALADLMQRFIVKHLGDDYRDVA
jgi:hypothetical protein